MANKSSAEIVNILGKLKRHFGKTISDASNEQIYQACAMCVRDEIMDKWLRANKRIDKQGLKRVYYMSAEFLMGRALVNNMINLDVYDKYKEALKTLKVDIDTIEEQEKDAGLGNGGLGRLAACFLESLATLELPAMGCGIRYEHGLFRQRILEGAQVELEDDWLDTGHVWEIEQPEEEVEVRFGGEIEECWTEEGLKIHHKNYNAVLAIPYDMPIVGYESNTPATLRLWSAKAKSDLNLDYFNRGDYQRATEEKELAEVISKVLYPEDNHAQGRQLRLKQFYFFTSATMQSIVKRHKKLYGDVRTLPEYVTVQINDTHPTLAIPELMRILMDEESLGWDEAFHIVNQVFNYTNHTIMVEALECWQADMFRTLLPRIYSIVNAINEKYCAKLWKYYPGDFDKISKMSIIAYNEVRMANLCVAVCGKVNGVSQLHGNILKTRLFRDDYVIEPQKFLAITNGVTPRRWLAKANQSLTALLKEYIGSDFIKDYREFEKIKPLAEDREFVEKFAAVKAQNKKRLAEYVWKKQGVKVNENALFDVQAKRLHEYKRQMLKVLHIISLYNTVKHDPTSFTQPCVFFFGAKASPGYARAKNIIRLINAVGDMVNQDPDTKDILQVVFLENYGVSVAEVLIPAADISEQISTAGMEASGTGNMKFMMNGALTLGTMDGANVEMCEAVGEENMFIFGATVEELNYMERHNSYHPEVIYEQNMDVRNAMSRLLDGSLPGVPDRQFADLYHSLLFGDYDKADKYYVLHDFASYKQAFLKAVDTYQNKEEWFSMAVKNTAASGIFSSDRTIAQYNEKIWHLNKDENTKAQ